MPTEKERIVEEQKWVDACLLQFCNMSEQLARASQSIADGQVFFDDQAWKEKAGKLEGLISYFTSFIEESREKVRGINNVTDHYIGFLKDKMEELKKQHEEVLKVF